ncbi:MAG: insulinase family protein [Bacteroidia bacterium]|nr:insulinase family protein [Bacteroidia bacterium]
MKRVLFSILAAGMYAGAVYAQTAAPKLAEEGGRHADGISIPYKKYEMANGLTVVVHEDHSDPIVYVDVTYHVGSARELPGRSGFAHFFEHMMFQGSDHVADEEHFKIVTESGGTLNGTTNQDRTNYFETLPSNQLEVALWLEADRMGWFLDAVTQQKFEIQRATVKNERGQNYDNRPYGLIYEKTKEALYPVGHPYSWTTIGYIEDLNAAGLDDLKNFFLRWYGPNNATLTISGDVNTEEALKLAEKYFGNIPRGPEVKNMAPAPVTLDKTRYMSYEDNVKMPYFKMTWPTVESAHPDAAALDVLAEIIGSGKNSMMYQTFVKPQLSVNAYGYHPTGELHGTFELITYNKPGTQLADIEKAMNKALEDWLKAGVNTDDLNRIKAKIESEAIYRLQSVQGKGSQLAFYETFYGSPGYFYNEIEKYRAVTAEKVMEVFKKYIYGKDHVCLSVVPKGQTALLPAPDNCTRWTIPAGFKPDLTEYKNLKYNKATDSFDRSKKPASGANPVITMPDFKTTRSPAGLQMISTYYTELPVSTLNLYLPFGQVTETPENAGISQVLAKMMNEGTQTRSAEAFDAELEKLGSDIRVYAGREEFVISVSFLNKNASRTLELLNERMFKPKFEEADLERIKNQTIQGLNNQQTQATAIANNVLRKLLFPNDIIGYNEMGTAESVNKITLADVQKYYDRFFAPDNGYLVSVGELSVKDLHGRLSFLGNWKAKGLQKPKPYAAKGVDKSTIYFIDKEGAAQSEIRVAWPSLYYDAAGDYYTASLVNFALGGAFNSRINLNLRELHGWTYGARGRFSSTKLENKYMASAGVKKEATDSSIIEIVREIKLYEQNGPTEEEILFTKNSVGQSEALDYETPGKKAGFVKMIIDNGADKNLQAKRLELLKNLSVASAKTFAAKNYPSEKLTIVVVGDKKVVFEGLKKLGLPIVELDINGNPIR